MPFFYSLDVEEVDILNGVEERDGFGNSFSGMDLEGTSELGYFLVSPSEIAREPIILLTME